MITSSGKVMKVVADIRNPEEIGDWSIFIQRSNVQFSWLEGGTGTIDSVALMPLLEVSDNAWFCILVHILHTSSKGKIL